MVAREELRHQSKISFQFISNGLGHIFSLVIVHKSALYGCNGHFPEIVKIKTKQVVGSMNSSVIVVFEMSLLSVLRVMRIP